MGVPVLARRKSVLWVVGLMGYDPRMSDDNAVPTFDALIIPGLKALKAMGGSASNRELLDKVI